MNIEYLIAIALIVNPTDKIINKYNNPIIRLAVKEVAIKWELTDQSGEKFGYFTASDLKVLNQYYKDLKDEPLLYTLNLFPKDKK